MSTKTVRLAAKKTMASDADTLARQVGVRLSEADYARFEGLAVTLSVSTLVRAALLIGLDVIEARPGVLLGEKSKARRWTSDAIIKRCLCGATYTAERWQELVFVGIHEEIGERLELRHCPCGSTIAIGIDETGKPR